MLLSKENVTNRRTQENNAIQLNMETVQTGLKPRLHAAW